LNRASLETIAKAKGGYVNGNNTKEVLAYVKSSLDNKKPNLSRRKLPILQSSILGFAFCCFWICFVGKENELVKKLNLTKKNKLFLIEPMRNNNLKKMKNFKKTYLFSSPSIFRVKGICARER
jgi:hypothetical protein